MEMCPAFFVPFLTSKAVSLFGITAKTGLAIRRELLSVDRCSAEIDDDVAGTQMVGELKLHRRNGIPGLRRADPNQRDALFIVHHVQMVVFVAAAPALVLEHDHRCTS